jgi:hypothetical protein
MSQKLRDRDEQLVRAAEVANSDPDVRQIEKEFDALEDAMAEPWEDSPSR